MVSRVRKPRLQLVALVAVAAMVVALAAEGPSGLALNAASLFGPIVTDANGNSLYLFTNDAQVESKCYDDCAAAWPPLLADGDVSVADGLDASLVGTLERTDGTTQVTYGGWPLYTFAGDTEPGAVNGHGRNGVWFLVAPDGTAVAVSDGSAEESAAESPEGQPVDDEAGAAGEDDLFAAYMQEGAQVFARICSACHGANGNEALASHVAILEENSRLENERRVLTRIIHGGGYMPGFGAHLTDREVAAVATFVRNSFGNEFGFIGEEAATAIR